MFRIHGVYQIFEEFESFYMNFPNQSFVDYFSSKKMDEIKKIFKEEL